MQIMISDKEFNKALSNLYGSNAPLTPQPQKPDYSAINDGDDVFGSRLTSRSGAPFDAYETGRYKRKGDQAKNQELKLLKQREALSNLLGRPVAEDDVFAKGLAQRDAHIQNLKGGATVNALGKWGHFGRELSTVTNPDGSDYADSMNTPDQNAAYYSTYNSVHRLRSKYDAEGVDYSSPRMASIRDIAERKKVELGGDDTNPFMAAVNGVLSGTGKFATSVFNAPLNAVEHMVGNTVSNEARRMYDVIQGKENLGIELTPEEKAFRQGKPINPERPVARTPGKLTPAEMYGSRFSVQPNTQGKDLHGINDHDRAAIAKAAGGVADDMRHAEEVYSGVLVDQDKQEHLAESINKKAAKYEESIRDTGEVFAPTVNLIGGTIKELSDNPSALVSYIGESVPQMLGAVAMLPATVLATLGEKVDENTETYRKSHNNNYPEGDDLIKLAGVSTVSAIMETAGDRFTGKALTTRSLVESLKPDEKQAISKISKVMNTTPAKLVKGVLSGATGEFAAEGTANLLDQYAGKQDLEKIDGKEAYTAASIGAAAGGTLKGTIDGAVAIPDTINAITPDSKPEDNLENGRGNAITELSRLQENMSKTLDDGEFGKQARLYEKHAKTLLETKQSNTDAIGDTVANINQAITDNDSKAVAKGISDILILGSKAKEAMADLPDTELTLKAKTLVAELTDDVRVDEHGNVSPQGQLLQLNDAITKDNQQEALERLQGLRSTPAYEVMEPVVKEVFNLDQIEEAANTSVDVTQEVNQGVFDEASKIKPTFKKRLRELSKQVQKDIGRNGEKLFDNKEAYTEVFTDPVKFATEMGSNKKLREAVNADQVKQLDRLPAVANKVVGQETRRDLTNKAIADVNNATTAKANAAVKPLAQAIARPFTSLLDRAKPAKHMTEAVRAMKINRDGELYKLAKELQGSDSKTLPWQSILRQSRADKETRKVVVNTTHKLVKDGFSRKVSKQEWEALTDTVLKPELFNLSEHYSSTDIVDLLRGNVDGGIKDLKIRLDSDTVIKATEAGLGGKQHNLSDNSDAARLATLLAIQNTDPTSKELVADLIESEYARDKVDNGITRMMGLHRRNKGNNFGELSDAPIDNRRVAGIVSPELETDPTIDNQAYEVLGRMVGKDKPTGIKDLLLAQAKADYEKYGKDEPDRFVKLSPDSKNKKHREIYHIFHGDLNGEPVMMQEALLDMVYGFNRLSATKHLPAQLYPLTSAMVKAHEGAVKLAKKHIVKYTPDVISGNIISNVISTTLATGTNPVKVMDLQQQGLRLIKDYQGIEQELAKLRILGVNKGMVPKLKQQLESHPIHVLAKEGMISGNVEDLGNDGHIKGVHSKTVESLTEYSDPAGKYAMYTILTRDKGMSHQEAIERTSDLFVNYDSALSPALQYLDDKGILPFMKWLLRIQRVIMRTLRDNPFGSIALEVLDRGVGDISDIQDGILPEKVGMHRVQTPVDTLENAAEIPVLRMFNWVTD